MINENCKKILVITIVCLLSISLLFNFFLITCYLFKSDNISLLNFALLLAGLFAQAFISCGYLSFFFLSEEEK